MVESQTLGKGGAVAERIDSIQWLRALAALAVVGVHTPLHFKGEWGVDLFFVISGFIICLVTQTSGEYFLAKRLIRVVPLYWLGTLCVYALAWVAPRLLQGTSTDVTQLFMSLFFIPFEKAGKVQPVLFLGWTLNYEMFYYAVFAVSMTISHAYRAVICSLFLLSLVVLGYVVDFESVLLAFYTSNRLIEFTLGMACFYVFSCFGRQMAIDLSLGYRVLLGACGLASLAVLLWWSPTALFLGKGVAFGVPASLSLLFIVHSVYGLDLPRAITILGDASYSLYLFHPYVLRGGAVVFPSLGLATVLGVSLVVIAVIVCCLLAIGCFLFVELPMTRALRKVFMNTRAS